MESRGGGRKRADELDVLMELRAELRRLLDETAELVEAVEIRPDRGIDIREEVAKYERQLITAALRLAKGRQNRAAELLHLRASTLCLKIKTLGIDPNDL